MDAGVLLGKFIDRYILGKHRAREIGTGRYVCTTGFVRAIPRHTEIKFYTDFHKEEKWPKNRY